MSSSYPGAIQTFTNPAGTSLLSIGPDHAVLHSTESDTLVALQNTLGTTSGTNIFLNIDAAGEFAPAVSASNVFQDAMTMNNSTLGTPAITGGTANNQVLGTPTINNSTLGTFTASGIYNNGTVSGLGTVNWLRGDRQVYTISANGTLVFT